MAFLSWRILIFPLLLSAQWSAMSDLVVGVAVVGGFGVGVCLGASGCL